MILSEHSIKHAKVIIKYCTDNGMVVESTMGLWNYLVHILSRLDVYEGRAARQVESASTDNQQILTMWIICNDKLPAPNTEILFVSQNCVYCGSLGCCDDGYKWYTEDRTIDLVSHWMPLPSPPNSEEVERNDRGGVAGEPGTANKQSDAITLWKRYAVAAQNGNALKWLRDNDKLIRAVIA